MKIKIFSLYAFRHISMSSSAKKLHYYFKKTKLYNVNYTNIMSKLIFFKVTVKEFKYNNYIIFIATIIYFILVQYFNQK